MSKKSAILIAVTTILIITIFLLGSVKQYYVIPQSGGRVFTREDEAILFMYGGKQGYHFSYFGRVVLELRQALKIPSPRNDVSGAMTIIELNQFGTHRVDLNDDNGSLSSLMFLTPFEDGIYAMCQGMTLCKWSGGNFLPATPEESALHGGLQQLLHDGVNGRVVNGWYGRVAAGQPGDSFDIKLKNGSTLQGRNRSAHSGEDASYLINLIRTNGKIETLYDVDGKPRKVNKVEYERTFGALKE